MELGGSLQLHRRCDPLTLVRKLGVAPHWRVTAFVCFLLTLLHLPRHVLGAASWEARCDQRSPDSQKQRHLPIKSWGRGGCLSLSPWVEAPRGQQAEPSPLPMGREAAVPVGEGEGRALPSPSVSVPPTCFLSEGALQGLRGGEVPGPAAEKPAQRGL